MKSFFKLSVGVIALALAQQASADVTIRLTGSTAFRAGAHKGIIAMMGGEANCKIATASLPDTNGNPVATAQTQTSYEGSDFSIIQGTATGISGITTVQCCWTGSATGVRDVALQLDLTFIPTSSLPASTGYANIATSQSPTQIAKANFAFSDVFQATTPTASPALVDNKLAVIPFCWVANKGTTNFTNMTQQLARSLYASGLVPKSIATGNAADTDYVLMVGRDNGSGTRISSLAETKYGAFTPVQQWKITTTGAVGSGSVVSAQLWPIGDGVGSTTAGNGGYVSGSTIRNVMGMTAGSIDLIDETGATAASGLAVTLVSWLGISDANTAVNTNGAVRLAYEGVTYDGSNTALIYEGRYSAWGYLHLYVRSGLTADETQFKNNMATQLDNAAVLGTAGLRVSQMNVNRQNDGSTIGAGAN